MAISTILIIVIPLIILFFFLNIAARVLLERLRRAEGSGQRPLPHDTTLALLRLVPEPGRITGGRILLDGEDVTALPPEKRNIAQVFQFPVLYDTMTVYDNLAFPLRNRGQQGIDAPGIAVADRFGQRLEVAHGFGVPGDALAGGVAEHVLDAGDRRVVAGPRPVFELRRRGDGDDEQREQDDDSAHGLFRV